MADNRWVTMMEVGACFIVFKFVMMACSVLASTAERASSSKRTSLFRKTPVLRTSVVLSTRKRNAFLTDDRFEPFWHPLDVFTKASSFQCFHNTSSKRLAVRISSRESFVKQGMFLRYFCKVVAHLLFDRPSTVAR